MPIHSRTYLDYNATALLMPVVADAYAEIGAGVALNPSSMHTSGRFARKLLEDARSVVAQTLDCRTTEIIFTASGTEANNMVMRGVASNKILISAGEHHSIIKPAPDASVIPINADGLVDFAALENMLVQFPGSLVSVIYANNETGVINNIPAISELCKKHGALLHTDATQMLGRLPLSFRASGADLMTVSAHKFCGGTGTGVLIARLNLPVKPLLMGGGQESNRRAGTENVRAIHGFAEALSTLHDNMELMHHIGKWRDAMEKEISVSSNGSAIIVGAGASRIPNTSCIIMPDVSNETQLMSFDLEGVEVSAGSACTSGKIEASHVLTAMGYDIKLASSAIRISGGWASTEHDFSRFAAAWHNIYAKIKKQHQKEKAA